MNYRFLRRVLIFLFLFLVLFAVSLIWWAGAEIAAPTRRALQNYHLEFLAHPEEHGVQLKSFSLTDGTPVWVCEPEPTGRLGARGQKIRDQMLARQVPIPPAGQIAGTLVLVHGRKGRKEDYLLIAERFCAVGFRCLLPDLPAHGDHPGDLAYYGVREAQLPASVLFEAAQSLGFDPQPAGLLGISMGGSVAMHAADQAQAPWKTLAIISSFHAFEPVIRQQASRFAGAWIGNVWAPAAGWVYETKTGQALSVIQPHQHAAKLKIPTLIAHGTKDRVVPFASGQQLFAALPEGLEKLWVEIPNADHDNVLITDFPIYATLAEWMLHRVR